MGVKAIVAPVMHLSRANLSNDDEISRRNFLSGVDGGTDGLRAGVKFVVRDLGDTVTAVAFSASSASIFAAGTVAGQLNLYDSHTGRKICSCTKRNTHMFRASAFCKSRATPVPAQIRFYP